MAETFRLRIYNNKLPRFHGTQCQGIKQSRLASRQTPNVRFGMTGGPKNTNQTPNLRRYDWKTRECKCNANFRGFPQKMKCIVISQPLSSPVHGVSFLQSSGLYFLRVRIPGCPGQYVPAVFLPHACFKHESEVSC